MAFMGLVLLGILIFNIVLMLACFLIAIVAKSIGKKKNKKGLRTVGNVCLVLGIVLAIPLTVLFGRTIYDSKYEDTILQDGSKERVSTSDIEKMLELIHMGEDGMEELKELLEAQPNLVHYLDINHEGLLEYGLKSGDYDLVMLAIEYGAEFDNPNRYDHMAYVHNSMEDYLGNIIGRKLTNEDVQIIKLMFEKNASTSFEDQHEMMYSNIFGMAVWRVLYNDEYVSDIEIEFIQVFVDNGLSEDENFVFYEDKPDYVSFGSGYCFDVVQDENYEYLVHLVE